MEGFLRVCLGPLLTMICAVWMGIWYGWDGSNSWGMGDIDKVANVDGGGGTG